MTERIEKDYGYLIMQDGKIYDYEGGQTGQGEIYKDKEAFRTGDGVCYISELQLEELHENLAELERAHYDSPITSEHLHLLAREDILSAFGETRQNIIDQVREMFQEDYMLTEKQIEYLAECAFNEADWASILTVIGNDYWIDSTIEYEGIRGNRMFTKFQYEAVVDGQTPKEYSDRQLSYGELAELDDEFDRAFRVDEECLDDWSDKGLGANARSTYVEQRRTGQIDGPEEFDCPDKFRK